MLPLSISARGSSSCDLPTTRQAVMAAAAHETGSEHLDSIVF